MPADSERIAIQGARGAFSAQAALQLRPGAALLHCPTFDAVFAALAAGAAALALLPIENTVAGPVLAAQALLAQASVRTVSETRLQIELALITRPGAAFDQLRRVRSHPVALAQCGRFLAAHPALVPEPAWDTAGSVADMMAAGDATLAAIASPAAAALYGAAVARSPIGDRSDNFTRFLLLVPR